MPVSLGLVMSDSALLGTGDEQVWVRRLWTSPTTGDT